MTRKAFLASLSAIPFLGAIAARLRGSEPMVKVDVAPKPKAEPECVPVDFQALLWAIGQVENGSEFTASRGGERSKYCITAAVWRQHEPRLPFTMCKGGKAWQVGLNHLHWLDRNILRETLTERYQREQAIAFAWNAGLDRWLKRKTTDLKPFRYAERVSALYLSRLNHPST